MSTSSPPVSRFRLTLAVLAGVAIGALAIAVAVFVAHTGSAGAVSGAGRTADVAWSRWRPNTTGDAGAAEIADYVGPFYRLNGAEQLVLITPVSVTQLDPRTGSFTGNGLTVALDEPTPSGRTQLSSLPGRTVAYELCGVATSDCAVSGAPSAARELLLRREALQLALYTFTYLPRTTNVVIVLPPGHTAAGRRVTVSVLFLRPTLAALLAQPIDDSLAPVPPSVAQLGSWTRTAEAELVSTATARELFSERVEAQQDGAPLLVLSPLPAQ